MEQPRRLREEEESALPGMSPTPHSKSVYKSKTAEKVVKVVSSVQILAGILCMVFQSVTLVYGDRQRRLRKETGNFYTYGDPRYPRLYSYADDLHFAPGIWIGLYYIITGVVGILSVKKNNKGLVIGMMVLNIILAAGFSAVMIGMMAGLISFLHLWDCKGYDEETGRYIVQPRHEYRGYGRNTVLRPTTTVSYYDCDKTPAHVSLALDVIMLVLALINFGIAISLSVAGCCYTCRCCNPHNQQLLPYQIVYQNGTDQQRGFIMAPPGVVFSQPGVSQIQTPANYNFTGQPASLPPYSEKSTVQIEPAT